MTININNILSCTFLMVSIFSCTKQQQEFPHTGDIREITDLNSYKIIKEKLNDSIIKVKGHNKNFNISGYFNIRRNKKDGWWKISGGKQKILDLEYILIGNSERKNQIIFYQNNMIDTAASKFYTKKFIQNSKTIRLSFYMPKTQAKVTSAAFNYNIITRDEVKRFPHVKLINKNGKYYCDVNVDQFKNNLLIKGLFKEFSELKNHRKVKLGASVMLVEVKSNGDSLRDQVR